MHSPDLTRSHCSQIVPGWLLSTCTVAGVLHKHVRGGGVRLRMLAALVQDGRTVYPGYASVEYVQVRCRSRHQHHGC